VGKLLLALGAALVAACATTAPGREAPRSDPRPEAEGRALYEESCQRCHALYMPSSFPADEWRFFVRKYGRKARLGAGDREKVFAYLSRNARDAG